MEITLEKIELVKDRTGVTIEKQRVLLKKLMEVWSTLLFSLRNMGTEDSADENSRTFRSS